MNKLTIVGSIAVLAIAITGCNKADTAAEVRRDVADAQADKSVAVAAARTDRMDDVNKQQQDVNAAQRDVNEAASKGNYDVALAKAEGDYNIAKQSCEALAGTAQVNCKDQAEVNYTAAKLSADRLKPM
jgi:PBP1b-binding outer membrane lipoprotein LpoB